MQVSVLVTLVALVGVGVGGLYAYSGSGAASALTTGGTGNLNSTQLAQNAKVDPGGKYLGFVPAGYTVASLLPTAPAFSCPSNMTTAECAQFKASCGNGVCDPNESCSTCSIDCGVPQGLSCDPYTGRAQGLGGICEVNIPYSNVVQNCVLQPGQTPADCPTPGTSG